MNDSIPDATRSPTSASLLPNSTEMKPLVCPGVLDSAVDADFREVKSVSIGEQHVGLKAILRSASPSRGAAEQRSSNSSSPAASLKITSRRQRRLRWRFCDRLTTKFPYAMVHPEPIFLQDGPIYTSAGIAAGIDLSLALVEEDQGHVAALNIARFLVMFLVRPGDQAQFSHEAAWNFSC